MFRLEQYTTEKKAGNDKLQKYRTDNPNSGIRSVLRNLNDEDDENDPGWAIQSDAEIVLEVRYDEEPVEEQDEPEEKQVKSKISTNQAMLMIENLTEWFEANEMDDKKERLINCFNLRASIQAEQLRSNSTQFF